MSDDGRMDRMGMVSPIVVAGGLASSAQHINQMGPLDRSDVWAWAQSSVWWWWGASWRGHTNV